MQEAKDGSGFPTTVVLLSADTGARTIISHRCGLKDFFSLLVVGWIEVSQPQLLKAGMSASPNAQELDPFHFEEILAKTSDIAWCHLECRQMPGVAKMLEILRPSGAAHKGPFLSLEIEKPGLDGKFIHGSCIK